MTNLKTSKIIKKSNVVANLLDIEIELYELKIKKLLEIKKMINELSELED